MRKQISYPPPNEHISLSNLTDKVKERMRGALHNSAAIVLAHNSTGENKVLKAINTEVLGIPTIEFDYTKVNGLAYNDFYANIDRSYSFQTFQMISTQEYSHLKEAVLLISYPIKTKNGNKWVSRRSCISKIIDSHLLSNAIVNIYSIINEFDGRLSLIQGRFIDPTVEIGNMELKFQSETQELNMRVGRELREELFGLTPKGWQVWSSKARNLSNREIASILNMSPHTVKDYITNVRSVFATHFKDVEDTKSISNFLSWMHIV